MSQPVTVGTFLLSYTDLHCCNIVPQFTRRASMLATDPQGSVEASLLNSTHSKTWKSFLTPLLIAELEVHDWLLYLFSPCPVLGLNQPQSVYIKSCSLVCLLHQIMNSMESEVVFFSPMPRRVPEYLWGKTITYDFYTLKKFGFPDNKCSLFKTFKFTTASFGGRIPKCIVCFSDFFLTQWR